MDSRLYGLFSENLSVILIILTTLGIWFSFFRKPRGIPPGPNWTLPLLGDLLSIANPDDGGDSRLPFRRLRKKYGDIFSVYLGPRLVVVFNGYKTIKDACINNADVTSHRPDIVTFKVIARQKGLFASSGDDSKEQRKAVTEVFRLIGKANLEEKIQGEIECFTEHIRKFDGKNINIITLVQASIANVIGSVVFGKRFEYDDELFKNFLYKMEENMTTLGGTNIITYFEFLRHLPGDLFGIKKVLNNVKYVQDKIIIPSIDDHIKHFDDNNTHDFISAYIKQMNKVDKTRQQRTAVDRENLLVNVVDLFVAGTDTTAATISWTILLFLHHPRVYDKCCKEVQEVVGIGRRPTMKDRPTMPYVEATIMEVLRYFNIGLLGGPHAASEDTYIGGYYIPKGTMLLFNLDSVLCVDEEPWGDVKAFRPERFLNSTGDGVKLYEEFIPFSLGRRVCIGESLARMELFLLITTLIQHFDLQPATPNDIPPLKGMTGLTHSPKHFEIRAIPR
ncbi:hypothetical protein LOTGIDRAFT_229889 [Lottia gigantea]|uniref:Uncharacterized protein n=1 Tax=Lottia gigantea TaxID=225164 RepID=V4CQL2_LOTGI|nr:hypothetical protein LOTGIDRAFT_229889 [Lottia gigantea]ESP04755.1 hypothetical protein LOTGIDRAFT_229889 [Lottia gigantea]